MSTEIYSHKFLENGTFEAGHINSDGEVYSHRFLENGTFEAGHVNSKGEVYSHRFLENGTFEAGHVNSKGEVYRHRFLEDEIYEAGHVTTQGIIYSHRWCESDYYVVGHVSGTNCMAAGAAFLLLLRNQSQSTSENNTSYNTTQKNYPEPGLTSSIVGAVFDFGFKIENKIRGINKPCKICGKKIDPHDYEKQDGLCFWCSVKKQAGTLPDQKPAAPTKPKSSTPVQVKPAASSKPKPQAAPPQSKPKITQQKTSSGIWGKNIRFTKCPTCGTRFRVEYPAGVKNTTIERDCPNPQCGQHLIFKV